MPTQPTPLTAKQLEGLACRRCGISFEVAGSSSAPDGYSDDGRQLFACSDGYGCSRPVSPRVLADILVELTEQAVSRAMARYPRDRTERLADEAAQLRTLLAVAVDRLRRMEEKTSNLADFARGDRVRFRTGRGSAVVHGVLPRFGVVILDVADGLDDFLYVAPDDIEMVFPAEGES